MLLENYKEGSLSSLQLFSPEAETKPDSIVLQLGYFGCYLAYNSQNGAKPDGSIESRTENNVTPFIKDLHALVTKFPTQPMVIFSATSRNQFMDYNCDICTWRMNRKIAFEAHAQGYMVFEREEIEYRLFFKSEDAVEPWILARNLFYFPVPQIVTSSFVSLLGCMERNISFHLF
jgi:hypothetical protein